MCRERPAIQQKRYVTALFSFFAVLALLDLAADLNMLVAINKDYQDYKSLKVICVLVCSTVQQPVMPAFVFPPLTTLQSYYVLLLNTCCIALGI